MRVPIVTIEAAVEFVNNCPSDPNKAVPMKMKTVVHHPAKTA